MKQERNNREQYKSAFVQCGRRIVFGIKRGGISATRLFLFTYLVLISQNKHPPKINLTYPPRGIVRLTVETREQSVAWMDHG